jgi:O-antigen/teichoic acid export membrane protein
MKSRSTNLLGSLLRGSFWLMSSKIAIQLMQFAVTMVLARLLSPDVFGVVAMVMVVRGFLNIFLTTGLGQGVIQRQNTNDDHLQTVFLITFALAVILFVVSWAFAPMAAAFFSR